MKKFLAKKLKKPFAPVSLADVTDVASWRNNRQVQQTWHGEWRTGRFLDGILLRPTDSVIRPGEKTAH